MGCLLVRRRAGLLALAVMVWLVEGGLQCASAQSQGVLSSDGTAAAAARGGTMLAGQGSPLEAMESNPAALAGVRVRMLELGGAGSLAQGTFRNTVDAHGRLVVGSGALPFGAVSVPVGSRWTVAGALTPEAVSRVDWRYTDPAGTAGASYGLQRNKSAIVALRTAAGAGVALGSRWAVGATVGLVYNENTLISPYIFQQQPQLAGLKVLVNLQTSGWGWDGGAGAQWQPSNRLRLGAAWKSGASIDSHGPVSGTASALFTALGVGADPGFAYKGLVENHLPQTGGLGVNWLGPRHAALSLDGSWTGWGSAFHRLPVRLTEGTNPTINSLVGGSALQDFVGLNWHDQYGVRGGVELPVRERWAARGGYGWQTDPVPSGTLTPLTAAVMRQTLGAGAGWRGKRVGVDAAYTAQLPAAESVGKSQLQAGEYDGSRVRVSVQAATVTGRWTF